MRKIFAMALFALIFISASARGRILMNEDFSWVPWGGNTTDCAYETTGECRIDFWGPSAQNKGWTSKTTWVWTRHNFVKLGKNNFCGDFCSPALKALGKDETVTATLTFQAVRYCNADGSKDNGGKLHVAVLNAGRITAISGGMTSGNIDKIDNTYTLSAYPNITSAAAITLDPTNISGKSGDSPAACWQNPLSKYTITIEGATAQTQILFVGGTYNAGPTDRICLDNVKVVTTDDDPNDMSTIIEMAGTKYGYGKMFAYQNNDINNIHFDYTKNVDLELYEPEKVIQHDTVYVGSVPKSLSNVHGYVGPKITLPRETNSYAFDIVAYNCKAGQSGAAYGDYLFVVEDKLAAIHMYDLKKNKMVYTCNLKPHEDKTTTGGEYILYHCNQSTFGTERVDPSDDFPVLYISQRAKEDGDNRCFVNVLRIVPTKNAAGEYTSFDVDEVQTIYLPKANTTNALSNANLTIDPQTGKFYTYSRTNNSGAANYKRCRITEFRHVSLTEGSEVYLNDNATDRLDSYEIRAIDSTDAYILPDNYVSAFDAQGAFIWDNKLYISQGIGNNTSQIYLRVVDLVQKQQINAINLYQDGFKFEPEGLFMHDGHIKVSTNGYALYTLYFE